MHSNSLAYLNFRARFYESRLEITKAISSFEQTLEFQELYRDPKGLASVLYHLALLNFLNGNDQEAIKFAQLCLTSSPEHRIAKAVQQWIKPSPTVQFMNELDKRSQMVLEYFHAESIPIVQALKLRHTTESGRSDLNSTTAWETLWRENDERLAKLENMHKDERAFVLGNGPSLSIEDLNKLKNEITFASNKIYLAFEKTDWRPTYYSVVDHLVMRNNQKQINALKGPVKFFPFYLDCCPPPTDNQLIFFDIVEDYYPHQPGFGTNFINGLHWGATVTYSMIQMASIMGIRELYLLGVDFSFDVPTRTNATGQLIASGEQNHFHPDYRPQGELWNMPNLHLHEPPFHKAKKCFEDNGGKIFNATRGGKLEIFPRKSLDSILE